MSTRDIKALVDEQSARVGRYWCHYCNTQFVDSLAEGAVCGNCGEEQREPFREGWDESD